MLCPTRRRRRRALLSAVAAAAAATTPLALALAASGEPAPDRATLAAQAARRFPHPVRVGDLIGRRVLEPRESQPLLGRVAAMVRQPDGALDMVVRFGGGLLGIGTRPIAVPVEAVALLGEHVVVMGYTPAQLATLPTAAAGAAGNALGPEDTIRIGLVKPFH